MNRKWGLKTLNWFFSFCVSEINFCTWKKVVRQGLTVQAETKNRTYRFMQWQVFTEGNSSVYWIKETFDWHCFYIDVTGSSIPKFSAVDSHVLHSLKSTKEGFLQVSAGISPNSSLNSAQCNELDYQIPYFFFSSWRCKYFQFPFWATVATNSWQQLASGRTSQTAIQRNIHRCHVLQNTAL